MRTNYGELGGESVVLKRTTRVEAKPRSRSAREHLMIVVVLAIMAVAGYQTLSSPLDGVVTSVSSRFGRSPAVAVAPSVAH